VDLKQTHMHSLVYDFIKQINIVRQKKYLKKCEELEGKFWNSVKRSLEAKARAQAMKEYFDNGDKKHYFDNIDKIDFGTY